MKYYRTIGFSLVFGIMLIACNGSDSNTFEEDKNANSLVEVEGGKFTGGILKLNSIEDYTSLFPAGINDIYSNHIASQSYEGLLRLNQKTLEVEPSIAASFEIDHSKKIYTFHLRKGVKYHDDPCFPGGKGREITAHDFKYCFEFLCSNHKSNKWSSLFRDKLLGAEAYALGKSDNVAGIRVVDDYTLELELINPNAGLPNLLAILAASVYPVEAIDTYGYEGMQNKIIGSGPFVPKTIVNGDSAIFIRNENYWRKDEFGTQMPFLNKVTFTFIKDKHDELKSFQRGELDVLWGIPVEEIPNIMGTLEDARDGKNKDFEVQAINSLNIQYYGFLNTSEVFSNVKVRKAFNYAIDRDSLIDFVLQGEGSAAHNGFVPEMKGYPTKSVKGYFYDPQLAKKLMREAGFPNGEGFPEITLNLNASGGINEKIAETLTFMLKKNLGINIQLNVIPMSQLHPLVERGQVDFWRFGWIADSPDPSNFLYLFYSKNIIEGKAASINYFRYTNPAFDELYEAALREINPEARMLLYAKADQILMDDAVVMPLYFNIDIRLVNPSVKDFDINALEYRDLSVVYFTNNKAENVRIYDNLKLDE
ncbi:ABC transporter substrate-binding protein [Crocinitomix catalasitica]|uniref:ABC transporter substrate-binding protein n=1 Tax=Crocinitomix catalasitica TaxID=184607 RepID=UPI00146FC148|nr:ABC transporter substrate-binding protein [Crocinitomix catalasitica]